MSKKESNRVVANPEEKTKQKKVRLTISLPEDIDSRLETLSSRMGVTKAQACSMMIGQAVFSWEQAWGLFSDPTALGQLLGTIQTTAQNGNVFAQSFTKSIEAGEKCADEILKDK